MSVKKVMAICPAGLGNRIKCMASAMKRSEDINNDIKDAKAKPYVYWPVNKECGCEFKHLFNEFTPIEELWKSETYSVEVDAAYGDAEINKSWKLINNGRELDFKYHKLSSKDINDMLPHIESIEPAQDIQDSVWAFVNKYKESFDKKEVIGVHVRKGDFSSVRDGREGISEEEYFVEKMRCLLEVNPDYKFLLCAEDGETEDKFRRIFGSKHIIYFPKRFRGRYGTNEIKEAFIDMLLLSSCHIIIGTFLSTFTEIAWWLGGCRAQVVIPGIENKKDVDKVLSKLPMKGEGIHKKVWRKIKIWGMK